jgi:3-hydroxyisobutyrate dehydrogenase
MKQRVAVLGVGTMGGGMAARLLDAGFPTTVWNRNPARAEPLRAAGARVAATPADAAADADVVLAMVADDPASREVWLGEEGALRGARPGTVLVECSTVSPGWVRELAAAAAERGCHVLDAPVTGSKPQAAAGALLFLVGGDAEVLERIRDVLAPMSRDVVHLGPTGSGALVKLINNFMCGVQAASLAEAMALIEKSGLERDRALGVLLDGAPGSPLVKILAARMTARDYSVNFALGLMRKDISYALAAAEEVDLTLETARAALRCFDKAISEQLGHQDMAAIVEVMRR